MIRTVSSPLFLARLWSHFYVEYDKDSGDGSDEPPSYHLGLCTPAFHILILHLTNQGCQQRVQHLIIIIIMIIIIIIIIIITIIIIIIIKMKMIKMIIMMIIIMMIIIMMIIIIK